ncbi:hypothetical protein ACFQ9V_12315 [Leifsonia sp. NPDC056665]|uniref:hypothetical protein n=1 Tax=Leifsonia sp. NPDC056665 TaxID=3345901 RepID=UPI0036A983EC
MTAPTDPAPEETDLQLEAPSVRGDLTVTPRSRVSPTVVFSIAVACWASGTAVFWGSVIVGLETLRRSRESSYHNPWAELYVVATPISTSWVWLPLLFAALCIAWHTRYLSVSPYPRLALAIVWIIAVPIGIVFLVPIVFLAITWLSQVFPAGL